MGHDISGMNKAGEEIAYARFSMGNFNASILYSLLHADKFNGGISGLAGSSTFTIEQMEKAVNDFKRLYESGATLLDPLDKKQIIKFLLDCLDTAKKEESVKVYFG